MKNSFLKLVAGLSLSVLFFSVTSFALDNATFFLEAYGFDTIAGYGTYLKTSKISPNENVIFDVINPAGENYKLSAYASDDGIAQVNLADYYTKVSGIYIVSAAVEGKSYNSYSNTFTVYPGDVSVNNSKIYPEEQVVHYTNDSAILTVKLIDNYENPITGHNVKLISSSKNDSISLFSDSDITDANGELSFKVSSDNDESVTYSAYDVTSDQILNSKAKVVYFGSSDYILKNPVPNSYLYASSFGNPSGFIDHFEFKDIPAVISQGDNITFTVIAYDSNDQTVTNYNGIVRFSTDSENSSFVALPEDYAFESKNLGSHTFSLALSFQKIGSYKIKVQDISNPAIFGEYDFIVQNGTSNNFTNTSTITISNPVPGTYSNNIQVISGKATPGAKLKVYDNEAEMTSLVADATGNFSHTTSSLPDGSHKIYVASVNEIGTIIDSSPIIEITIDTEAPQISQVTLEPSDTVAPNTNVTTKMYTKESLSRAALLFQDNIYELKDSSLGYYEGAFPSPNINGQYPLTFIIVDQLGNETKFENAATLKVGGASNNGTLGDVTNLKATPADHRITLQWTAPSVHQNNIKNYRIYYGLSPNQLTEVVDTFTNSTTWYIPNLKNGVEYYLGVVAVDEKSNASEHFSNIVASTPGTVVTNVLPPDVKNGTAGTEALNDMKRDASQSGPEIMWVFVLSIFGGVFYVQFFRKRNFSKEKINSYEEIFDDIEKINKNLQSHL